MRAPHLTPRMKQLLAALYVGRSLLEHLDGPVFSVSGQNWQYLGPTVRALRRLRYIARYAKPMPGSKWRHYHLTPAGRKRLTG